MGNKIRHITGIRRCGKSSLMEMIKQELLDNSVDEANIIYIDLDKRGYKSIKTGEQLEKLIIELLMLTKNIRFKNKLKQW